MNKITPHKILLLKFVIKPDVAAQKNYQAYLGVNGDLRNNNIIGIEAYYVGNGISLQNGNQPFASITIFDRAKIILTLAGLDGEFLLQDAPFMAYDATTAPAITNNTGKVRQYFLPGIDPQKSFLKVVDNFVLAGSTALVLAFHLQPKN
jgi:hypothetical protein